MACDRAQPRARASAGRAIGAALLLVVCACGPRFSAHDGDAGGTGASGTNVPGDPIADAGAVGAGPDAAGAGGSLGESAGEAGAAPSAGAGGAGSTADECPCVAPTPTCDAGRCVVRGPVMVRALDFYIDSTEVTRSQYAAFQAAQGADTSEQAPECAWNDTYEPAFDASLGRAEPNFPITRIDYCDAVAFCVWADKRLCGKTTGGELSLVELADATTSQWFAACAGPKAQHYPYGGVYRPGECNDSQLAGGLRPVAEGSKCQGYYPGLFDMLGNAQEWTDACNARLGRSDGCERIGGSYLGRTVCSESGLAQRDFQDPALGFRCCSK